MHIGFLLVSVMCVTLWMQAEASDHALPISTLKANTLSTRPRTAAFVDWEVWDSWKWRAEEQESPDISSVLNEVLNRPGWRAGNALMLVVRQMRTPRDFRTCEV